ncbi:MAG: phage holin family protein [Bacteroidetes bacterium]|jgi:putative membrane protein|nr:phage holin family protein [Bacteroidota bacterium]
MNFIIKLIVSALAVFIVAHILPGVSLTNYVSALLVAIVLAFLNAVVKPILTILTIPVTVVTLGLFLLAINAIIILFADKIVSGFSVNGFWTALFFSIILSFITGILNMILGVKKEDQN